MKKKIFSLLVLLVAAVSGAWADVYEVQIGEGTSTTNYHPFYTLYNYSISESLYLASELTAAGVEAGPITSLSWYATNQPGHEQQGISIWLANVSDTELTTSSHSSTGMTQVYTNGTVTPVIGWNEFQCNGDFSWDGTSNLLILVQRNNGEWNSTVNWQATSGLSFNCMAYRYQDNNAYDVTASNEMYTSTTRPNIIIKGESAVGFSLTEGENEHGTIAFTNAAGKTITSAAEGQTVTVTITPETGYAVDEVTGKWYAAVANSRRIQAEGTEIGLLSDIALTAGDVDETTGAATYTFTMERANVQFNVTYKHRHIWGFSVVDGSTLKAVCQNLSGDCDVPSATVTTEITLPEDIIYGIYKGTTIELDEFNETLDGEAEAKVVSTSYAGTLLNGGDAYGPSADVPKFPGNYTVTIKVSAGGNEYTVSKGFTLEQKALEQEMVVPIANCVYNGKLQEPEVSLKYGNEVLKLGKDYEVSYDDNINAGLGIVTIKGLGNFTGTTYATFNILDKEFTSDMIEAIADQSYTGQAIEPAVVVKDGETVLEEGRDYSVTYENNVEVGTATVIVTAWTSGNYRGEIKATFNIVGTTGISAANSQQPTANRYYDLGGRKAKATKKGVVIVDGKKIMVK